MDWRISDIVDAALAPTSIALFLAYHAFLCYKVRASPFHTTMGINRKARRLWVYDMFIDNQKKNVLAVQTLRNSIMESTLMATTAVLLSAGLATYFAFATSGASGTRALPGAGQRVPGGVKLMGVLASLLASFFAHTLSIRFVNHVNYMVNLPLPLQQQLQQPQPQPPSSCGAAFSAGGSLTPDYVAGLLERATVLYTLGSRAFYMAFPLLLWVFGSVPMFAASLLLLHALYVSDFHHPTHPPPSPKLDLELGAPAHALLPHHDTTSSFVA